MAWTDAGFGVLGSSKTAGTTLTMGTITGAIGTVCVITIALDNTSTTDGQTSEVSSISDTKGNTWAKAIEFCNGQGGAASGATVSVWWSQFTATNAVPTINFANSITAKAVCGDTYTIGSGNSVSVMSGGQTLANDAADPGSMTISGLASQQYLFVRGVASEAASIQMTATANYTATTVAGTTGGSAVTNMTANMEYRIFTGTGDTSDPIVSAVDSASVYIAFKEVVPTVFIANPNKPILQAVNRAATY